MTPYRELIEDFDGSLTGTVKLANGEYATAKCKGKMKKKIELRIKDGYIKLMDGNELIFKSFSGGSDLYIISCQAYKANGKIVKRESVKGNADWYDCNEIGLDCDTCLKREMKRTGFTDSVSRTSAVLDLVHSDVVGKITPPSTDGAEYFVTFMADYSSTSSRKVWAEALSTANYIRNRCPSQANNEQIPFQLWFDKDLTEEDIKHIYIFGCQVRAATLANGKLSSRADEYTPCPSKPLVHEQENEVEMPAVEERNEDEESEKLHLPVIRGSSKRVFCVKCDKNGKVDKYTARLVAQGHKQVIGVDYWERYSPVIKRNTLRILISFTVQKGLCLRHIDVPAVYLNSPLTTPVYMLQPSYWEEGDGEDLVYLIKCSTYGLHQTGKECY
ncbi:hypothetical protein PR048_030656 [Dryococelus australis]|uniref:Reverse transcriptase Ty1/copia-type domain-containing protein n=1 Tax=Dryococelus australis TaxID=614101 RepID=A0ABQ9G9J3_9NEOP|nr:hypothetical protein PR048_030656 [Dryococelus australis]